MKKFLMTSFYHSDENILRKYSLASLRLGSFLTKHTEMITSVLSLDINSPVDEIVKEIKKLDFDILGLSAYMWTSKKVMDIIQALEIDNEDKKIIIGGPDIRNIDINNENIIKVLGEGEIPLYKIISDICGKEIADEDSQDISNTIPLYSKEMLDSLSISPESLGKKYAYYETNRGCLYSCGYCGRKTREKIFGFDNLLVKEEVINIGKLGLEEIFIVDPILGGTKERGKDVLRLFSKYAPNTKLTIYLRPEFIDDEYVDLLKKSSLRELRVGIQSINEKVPTRIRSNNIIKVKEGLIKFRGTQIPWRSELIAGLPGDSFDGLLKSMSFVINELQPTYSYTYPLSVIEGTKLNDIVDKTSEKIWIKKNDNNQATSSSSYNEQDFKKMVSFASSINALYMYINETKGLKLPIETLEEMIERTPCFQKQDFIRMAEMSDYQGLKVFLSHNI